MKNSWKFLSQKGSMMVEALAMLGLITMVTPVLYKKAAERTTELQDINTATQMRTLSKALDDYIGDNYNDLADGPEGETEIDKADIEPYLPYNFNLDASKLFDDFQFAIRNEIINAGTEKEHSAITGVVLAKAADEIPMLRASKIASMVGANGGVVRSKEIQGVQGAWGAPVSDFFASDDVVDGSLATSSVHAVTASGGGGGGADAKHVLYRDTSKGDLMYNTMETTLYMGGENLEDVSKIVAATEAGRDGTEAGAVTIDGKLISTGDLDVGGGASITGDLTAQSATISGSLTAGGTTVASLISNGTANIAGLLTAGAGVDVTSGGVSVKEGDVSIDAGKLTAKGGAIISGSSGENDAANSEYSLVSEGNLLVKNNAHVIGDMKIDAKLIADNLYGENELGGGNTGSGYNFVATPTDVTIAGNNLMVGDSIDPRLYTTDTSVQAGVGTTQMLLEAGTASLEASGSSVWVNDSGNAALQGTGQVEVRVVDEDDNNPTYLSMDKNGAILHGDTVTARTANTKLEMSNGNVQLGLISTTTAEDGTSVSNYSSNLLLASDGAVLAGTGGGVLQPQISLTSGDVEIQGNAFSVNTDNLQIDEDNIVLDENAEIPENEDSSNYANRSSGIRINRGGIIQLPAAAHSSKTDLSYNAGKQNVPGYIKLDRVLANQAFPEELGSGDYSLYVKGDGGKADHSYDAYQVNPAYTSVMHDIKLTTRGGARLSDILPDFINKGIYVLDNTYQEETGKTSWENYTVSVGSQVTVDGAPSDCTSSNCIATPWLGFVPTPQCPPGYSKVITISPIRWKMAEAYYIPGSKPTAGDVADKFRAYFMPPTDPTTAHFELDEADGSSGAHTHALKENSGFPLTFQTNTWLNTTVSGVKGDGGSAESSGDQGPSRYDTFIGWHAIMGFLYYAQDYKEYLTELGQGSLASQNVVVWNLFPVYNEEMTAIANVYCYFERRDIFETPAWSWDSNYVDTGYDQLTNFRFGFEKDNNAYNERLNDPALEYDEVW